MRSTVKKYFSLSLLLMVLLASRGVFAQSFQGPDYVAAGEIADYSDFDDIFMTNPYWTVTGGTIISQSHSGLNHYVQVQWTGVGVQTLAMMDGGSQHGFLQVTVYCPAADPSSAFTYSQNCGNTVITRSSSPPANTTWYWQTSAGGEETTNGSDVSFTAYTEGIYYLRARDNTYSCWSPGALATSSVTIIPLPVNYSVVGGGSYCTGGNGVSVTLSSSQAGINYQLKIDGANSGSPVSGGSTVTWTNQTTAGTYTVVGTNATTGCSQLMNSSATVTVNPLPTVYTLSGGGSYCTGGSGVQVTLSGSQSGTNYQLKVNEGSNSGSPVAGTGSQLSWSNQTLGGSYTVVATSGWGCVQTMSSNANVTVIQLPSSYSVGGGGTYCTGGSGVPVTLSGSEGGVNYQLKVNGSNSGSPVNGNGIQLTWNNQTTVGNYTVVATNVSAGCTQTMGGSTNVSTNPLPTAFTVGGGGAFCSGGSGVSVTLSSSQSGINYQLKVNGSNSGSAVAGTGSNLTWNNQTTGGAYTIVATNTSTGCSQTMNGSATVTVNALPTLYTAGGGGSYCSGGSGVSVTLNGSQSGVNYQLKINGSNSGSAVAGTGASLTWANQTTSGTYTVVATNASTGCSQTMSGNASVFINSLPSQYTVGGGGTYCSGGSGVSITLSGSQSGVNYQLKVNGSDSGSSVAGTGVSLAWSSQTSGGTYTVVATSASTGCTQTMTGSATVTVNALPIVYTVAGGGGYCSGGSGTAITLNGSQAGVNYQLKINGSPSGSPIAGTGSALNWNNQTLVGSYTISATNTSTGCGQTMSSSTTVSINSLPVVTSSSSSNNITYGVAVSLSTGTFTSYAWNKDGISIPGATQSYFTVSEPGNYTVTTGNASGPVCTSTILTIYNSLTNQPAAVNRVSTIAILKEGLTESSSLFSLQAAEVAQVISYSDGLGRSFQTIAVGQSPSRGDLISQAAFTRLGLVDSTFLPYATTVADGRIRLNAIRGSTAYNSYSTSEQYLFYQNVDKVVHDAYPYSRSLYKDNPSMRVYEQGATGQDWQPGSAHTVRSTLAFNDATTYKVRYWKPNGTTTGYYPDKSVSVSITTDENGNQVRTYTNALGQSVLKQVQIDETIEGVSTAWLETYFIYDEFGRLKYQVPPKALKLLGTSDQLNANDASVAELIYTYTYDIRGRLTEKKVPGAAVEYIVYDKLDRVAFTQDGTLRALDRWAFVKYDRFNRTAYNGYYSRNVSRTTLQGEMDARNYDAEPWIETEQVNATYQGYSNSVYPTTNLVVLGASYYDHYDFDRNGTSDYSYDNTHFTGQEASASTRTRGMATGSKTVLLDNAGNVTANWLISAVFYDKYGRPIQTVSNNHLYLTVADKNTVIYDFARALRSKSTHYSSASVSVTTTQRQVYDHAGRLLRTYHSINGAQEKVLAAYRYNELGQLIEKNLHCQNCREDVAQGAAQPASAYGDVVTKTSYTTSENHLVAKQTIYLEPGYITPDGSTLVAEIGLSQADYDAQFTTASNFLQSIDYRYNVRGWLSSINNAQLANDGTTNDDANDYFGMEMAYNTAVSGLSNTQYYNGNVSALKWKGPGQDAGAASQRSYKYNYDKTDKLKTSTFQAYDGSAWTREANTLNESMSYDHNGNILSLNRSQNQRGLSGINVTSTPQTIDNLAYTYTTGNQLSKVEDAGLSAGFNNGTVNGVNEYTYNDDGSLVKDDNKGISAITYNMLGVPQQITFTDGRSVVYTYDASGNKLKMAVTISGVTTTTDYAGSFVYQNSNLSFFGSPEGRVIKNGSNFEYQYALGDHQGNTRVVFSSAASTPVAPLATFEGDANDNASQYQNVSNIVTFNAAASSGTKVVRMNQSYRTGPSKSIKVFPGDAVDMEVWTYYESASGYGATNASLGTMITSIASAFGGVSGGGGESGSIYNGVNNALTAFGMGANNGDAQPAAYLNYIQFDQSYNVLDAGWTRVPASANFAKQKITIPTKNIKDAGYMFVYLSYENQSNNFVYFDDFKVTHTKTSVIQYNEYYSHGAQTQSSWTRESALGNNFLGNGSTELNTTTNLFDLDYRNFDPVLGRMHGVDPVADKYSSITPYNFAFNDPVSFNDPSGADPPQTVNYSAANSEYYTAYTYDDRMDYNYTAVWHDAMGWRNEEGRNFLASATGYGANMFGMDKYWHPGDGRVSWGSFEAAYRELRGAADAVRYGDMSAEQYGKAYGQSPLAIIRGLGMDAYEKHSDEQFDDILNSSPVIASTGSYKSWMRGIPLPPGEHRVKRNENLYSIGRRYKISAANLRYINHMSKKEKVRAGQLIKVDHAFVKFENRMNTEVRYRGKTTILGKTPYGDYLRKELDRLRGIENGKLIYWQLGPNGQNMNNDWKDLEWMHHKFPSDSQWFQTLPYDLWRRYDWSLKARHYDDWYNGN